MLTLFWKTDMEISAPTVKFWKSFQRLKWRVSNGKSLAAWTTESLSHSASNCFSWIV